MLFAYQSLDYFLTGHAQKKYDIVVFGASGFTGQFVVEEVARTINSDRYKWAVAGRDMNKVQAVLTTASKMTGEL